ncbi:hypothetical protein WN943_015119 [Citrus x changshan-huyou]
MNGIFKVVATSTASSICGNVSSVELKFGFYPIAYSEPNQGSDTLGSIPFPRQIPQRVIGHSIRLVEGEICRFCYEMPYIKVSPVTLILATISTKGFNCSNL